MTTVTRVCRRCQAPMSKGAKGTLCHLCMPLVPGSNNRFPTHTDAAVIQAIVDGASTIKALSTALGQSYNNKTNLITRLERFEAEGRIIITRRANRHGGWILKGV